MVVFKCFFNSCKIFYEKNISFFSEMALLHTYVILLLGARNTHLHSIAVKR